MARHEDSQGSSCFIKKKPGGKEGTYTSDDYEHLGEWAEYYRTFNKTPPPKKKQGLTRPYNEDEALIVRVNTTPMSHEEAVAIDALWGGPLAPRNQPRRDDSKPQEDDPCPSPLVQSVETPQTPDPSPTPPPLVQSAKTPPASIDRSRTPSPVQSDCLASGSQTPAISETPRSSVDTSPEPSLVQSDCLASGSQTPARSETPPTPIDTSPAPARSETPPAPVDTSPAAAISETPPAPIGTSPAPARSESQERILKIGIDKLTTLGEATKQIIFEREHYHQLLTDMKGQLTVKETRIQQLEAELQAARRNNLNNTSIATNGTTSSVPLMPQPQLEHGAPNLNQYWVCCLMLMDGSGVQCHGINPEWHKLFKAGDGGKWTQRIQCVRCGRKNKSNRKTITHVEAKMLAAVTPQGRIDPYGKQPRQTPSQTPSQTPLLLSGSRMAKKVPQPVYQQPIYQQPIYQQPIYQQPMYQQPVHQQPVHQQPMYQQPMYQQPMYQQPMAQPTPYNALPVIFTATSNTATQVVQNRIGTIANPLDIDHRKFMGITTPSPAPAMPQSIPEINQTQVVQAPPNVPALPKTNLTLPKTGLALPQTGLTLPQTGLALPQTGLTLPKTGLTLPQTGLALPQTISNIQLAPTKLTFPTLPQSTSNTGTKRPAPASPPKSDPPAPKRVKTSFNIQKATQEILRRELPQAQKAWMKPGYTSTSGEDEDDLTIEELDFLAEFNAALEATVTQ